MKTRVLTALVLIPVVLYVVVWAPWWVFFLVLLAVAEGGVHEYFALCGREGHAPSPWLGYAAVLALCAVQQIRFTANGPLASRLVVEILVLVLMAGLVVELFHSRELGRYLAAAGSLMLGVVYAGLTCSLLIPLRTESAAAGGPRGGFLVFLFLVIWVGDACAYFGGRGLGRTPLFPRVSPKKTVEGAVTGLVGGVLAGWIFTHWFWPSEPLRRVLVTAVLVAIAGQLGDLAESALKRSANVKDSGSVLPGHGGVLDRIDGVLFGAPVLWIALRWWLA